MKKQLLYLPILILFFVSPLLAGGLQVHFIDVGQGDSILVIAPNGKKLLIDAGIHAGPKDKRNPFKYIRGLKTKGKIRDLVIDYAVVTHNHDDHYKGFSYLSKQEKEKTGFTIPTVLYAVAPRPHTGYWKSVQPLIARSVSYGQLSARGPPIDLGEDVKVHVLYPAEPILAESDDKNDDSIILKLTYKDVSLLFMADAGSNIEALLQDVGAPLFKVGHHGARTSSSADFLQRVHYASGSFYAVISCNDKDGKGKTYGHPHREALSRIRAIPNVNLYRTDLSGTIVVITDGDSLVINKERSAREAAVWQPGKKYRAR